MEFFYDPDSPYGEDIQTLSDMVALLKDHEKTYTSAEVHDILSEITAAALRIRRQVDKSSRAYDVNVLHTA